MKLTLGDKVYESDMAPLTNVSIREARAIREQTGFTIADWEQGLKTLYRVDDRVLTSLVFLLRSRAGETVEWAEIDALTSEELSTGLDFTLTEGDQARIAEAGAKDWAEIEATQAQATEGDSATAAEGDLVKDPIGEPGRSVEDTTVEVEEPTEAPAAS